MTESIYVKFDYSEALQAKKDLLIVQAEIVKSVKNLRVYRKIRDKELKLKTRLKSQTSKVSDNLRKLHQLLPHPRLNSIHKEHESEEYSREKPRTKEDINLESQLREIQEKLRMLG